MRRADDAVIRAVLGAVKACKSDSPSRWHGALLSWEMAVGAFRVTAVAAAFGPGLTVGPGQTNPAKWPGVRPSRHRVNGTGA